MRRLKSIFKVLILIVISYLFAQSFNNEVKADNTIYPTTTFTLSSNTAPVGETVDLVCTIDAGTIKGDWKACVVYIYVDNPTNVTFGEATFQTNKPLSSTTLADGRNQQAIWDTYIKLASYSSRAEAVVINIARPNSTVLLNTDDFDQIIVTVPVTIVSNPNSSPVDFTIWQDDYNEFTIGDIIYSYMDGYITCLDYSESLSVKAPSSSTSIEEIIIDDTAYNQVSDINDLISNGYDVEASKDKVTIEVKAGDGGSVKEILSPDGTKVEPSDGKYEVLLNGSGETSNITITILAEDNISEESFIIPVNREKYDVSTLKSLNIKAPDNSLGDLYLDKEFESLEFDYVLNISEGIGEVNVEALPTENVSIKSVTINGGTGSNISIEGKDKIEVIVTAQDDTTSTYTITINRLSDNNDLDTTSLHAYVILNDNKGEEISLINSSNKYSQELEFAKLDGFMVEANASSNDATISFNPSDKKVMFDSFDKTTKEIVITITSQSNIAKDYVISITRKEASSDVSFDLTVKGEKSGNLYEKISDSTEEIWVYEVPSSEVNVVVDGTTSKDTTTISGLGTYAVGQAENVKIVVTPQYATKAITIYLSIRKSKEVDNTISLIELLQKENGGNLLDINNNVFEFDKDIDTYLFKVEYAVKQTYVNVTYPNSGKIFGMGLVNLSVGDNNVTVYCESESGVAGTTYNINIQRQSGSDEAYLTDLKFNGKTIDGFYQATLNYEIIDRNLINVTPQISYEAAPKATVVVSGVGTLKVGQNNIILKVTSEDESNSNEYTITVYVASTETRIKNITITGNDSNPLAGFTFKENITSYEVSVPYNISNVEIEVTPYDTNQVITGAGSFALPVGDREFKIFAISEYGKYNESATDIKSCEYLIKITRSEPSDDNSLKSLSVKINGIEQIQFDKDNPLIAYVINNIESDVTKANITFELNHEEAKYRLVGIAENGDVNLGTNTTFTATIVVIAQDLSENTIAITFNKKGAVADTDSSLKSIKVLDKEDGVEIKSLGFVEDDYSYEIEVEYSYSQVYLDVLANSYYASVAGNGLKNLVVGKNTFQVYGISQSGSPSSIYTIIVNRKNGSDEAYFEEFKINNEPINLDKSVFNYDYRVNHNVLYVDIAYQISDNASLLSELNLRPTLSVGLNTIYATVISETGVSNLYTFNIYRADNDYGIKSIKIYDQDDNLVAYEFDEDVTTIDLILSYSVKNVTFVVEKSSQYATSYGEGTKNLAIGDNHFTVYVVSEYGKLNLNATGTNSPIYVFNITRLAANDDNSLKDMEILVDGVNVLNYDSLSGPFIVSDLPDNVTQVTINPTPSSSNATLTGAVGIQELRSGTDTENAYVFTFTFQVVSESGKIANYVVKISRNKINLQDDNTIVSITAVGSDNVNYIDYLVSKREYHITVPYNVTNIVVTALGTTGAGSTVYGNGGYELSTDAITTIELYCVSESGLVGKTYTLLITKERAKSDNNALFIKIDGSIIEGFDENKTSYNYTVIYNTESVDVDCEAKDSTATVSGIGNYNLSIGLNTVVINITAQNGDVKPYTINITRQAEAGKLSMLYVVGHEMLDNDGNVITFDEATLSYRVIVESNVDVIEIIAQAGEGIEIRGDGKHSVSEGSPATNVFSIDAIPNVGNVTTYKITVIKKIKPTSDTSLISMKIVEIPEFESLYSNDINIYYANNESLEFFKVGKNVEQLHFEIVVKNQGDEFTEGATYEILGDGKLNYGKNSVVVIITANDGITQRVIIVNVLRDGLNDLISSDDSNTSNVLLGILIGLLLITILAVAGLIIIKVVREKKFELQMKQEGKKVDPNENS